MLLLTLNTATLYIETVLSMVIKHPQLLNSTIKPVGKLPFDGLVLHDIRRARCWLAPILQRYRQTTEIKEQSRREPIPYRRILVTVVTGESAMQPVLS